MIYRVPLNYPGAGRRVYPGFLQHTGFVAMNPDRHLSSHYDYFLDLVRGDDDKRRGHRDFYDEYNAVLDMPAEYYLDTIKTVFQDFALVNGTWEVDGELVRPQDITTHRAADDRGRARRHLRRRPDPGGARPVHRHPEAAPVPLRRRWAPATTASSPAGAGARRSIPEVRDFIAAHQPRTARRRASGAEQRKAPRPTARKAPSKRRTQARAASAACTMAVTDLAARIDDALPQTQCTRCGYPDCRGYAEAIAAGDADINHCPPGGAEGIARLAALTGRAVAAARPELRHRRPARAGGDRRGLVHRLHAVPQGLPGRLHRRRAEAACTP